METKFIACFAIIEKNEKGQSGVSSYVYDFFDEKQDMFDKLHSLEDNVKERMKKDGIDEANFFEHYLWIFSDNRVDYQSFEKTVKESKPSFEELKKFIAFLDGKMPSYIPNQDQKTP